MPANGFMQCGGNKSRVIKDGNPRIWMAMLMLKMWDECS